MHYFFLLIWALFLQFYIHAQVPADSLFSDHFAAPVRVGMVENDRLAEISGLTASRTMPGYFWTHNDSGDGPYLYLLDSTGRLARQYELQGASNVDWEDITWAGNDNHHLLYVGDIGDNFGQRSTVDVYQIAEPRPNDDPALPIPVQKKFICRYEDGPRDAEALLYDPIDDRLYIVTKRDPRVRLYAFPPNSFQADTVVLTFVSELPFRMVTGGDISANGQEVFLKNYKAIFYWQRNIQDALPTALASDHSLIRYNPEPQGEAIAAAPQGLYTISERLFMNDQILYFHQRKDVKTDTTASGTSNRSK
jgi:hypothetical protein